MHSNLPEEPAVSELKPPLWFKIVFPVAIVGGGILFILFPFIRWLRSSVPNTPTVIIANLFIITLGIWFIWQGANRMWHEAGFAIRADTMGITLCTRSKTTFANWHEIAACVVVPKNEQGKNGYWITLLDRHNNILLQWDRNWYRFSSGSLQKFDKFTELIKDKLDKRLQTEEKG